MGSKVRLVSAAEVAPGTVRSVQVGEHRVALCNVDGAFHLIADVCTHDGGPLDQGKLIGCEVECPRHGARFDVRSGRATRLPAIRPVATYAITVEDGAVWLDTDELD